jgi:hypothetical protein
MIFGEKIELKVYVNQHDFLSDIQTPIIIFLIMSFTNTYWIAACMSSKLFFQDAQYGVTDIREIHV